MHHSIGSTSIAKWYATQNFPARSFGKYCLLNLALSTRSTARQCKPFQAVLYGIWGVIVCAPYVAAHSIDIDQRFDEGLKIASEVGRIWNYNQRLPALRLLKILDQALEPL
jgi:hypothetical protein